MLINYLKEKLIKSLGESTGDAAGLKGIKVEEPNNKKFGDLSTNAALVLAPVLKKSPMVIAGDIKGEILSGWHEISNIDVVEPGFINFSIDPGFMAESLAGITRLGGDYGRNDSGRDTAIQLEYVSSNPTGDLHIGHGRWGALGDSLANIYAANGYRVFREYYVNDSGTQAEKFIECSRVLYLENFGTAIPYPEDGYPRETVSRAVRELIKQYGKEFLEDPEGTTGASKESFGEKIIGIMVSFIGATLEMMGVEFDNWFYESSLYRNGNFNRTIDRLKKDGLLYGKEGAWWFRSSRFGDEKDRVVIRSDGQPTYFASDIMYLADKKKRGYDRILYILGADHHGYVDRLMAIGKALGLEESRLTIIIGQLVNLVKDGKTLKMSKRKGKIHTLKDLIEEVGSDAVRYFFAASSFDTPVDFDIGLAKEKSNNNPVYYIQYAHARIKSVMKKIREAGPQNLDLDNFSPEGYDPGEMRLESEAEKNLAKVLILYPDAVYNSCINNAPHIIAQYLYRLAGEFHYFYNNYRILDETGSFPVVNMDRFFLALTAGVVIKNALGLLGISAPEKM
ncbi:MAG: arginine--tRNA ligase [Actinobacteria bacterium]|nr:arginine--tRNA ligase [Actinomycetota bacterium]